MYVKYPHIDINLSFRQFLTPSGKDRPRDTLGPASALSVIFTGSSIRASQREPTAPSAGREGGMH